MADKVEIKENIRRIALGGKLDIDTIVLATVTAVNGNLCDCTPLDESLPDIIGARLSSEDDTTNFLITPAVNSVVGLVGDSDKNGTEYSVVLFGEIDTIAIRGDQFGGLVKVQDLVDKLNDIENKVNDIINGFNSHIHPTPSGASSPPTSPLVGTLTNTTVNDLENDNVFHG